MGTKRSPSARNPLEASGQTVVQLPGMELPRIQPERPEIPGFLVPR